jgi:hypothetical protein
MTRAALLREVQGTKADGQRCCDHLQPSDHQPITGGSKDGYWKFYDRFWAAA